MRAAVAGMLFVAGYPTAVVVLARFRAVLRERRWRWFLAHQGAMVAITVGWLLLERPLGVAINGAWFAVAGGWWLRHRR